MQGSPLRQEAGAAPRTDSTLGTLADFSAGLRFEDLSPDVVHDCRRRVIDTLGCGVGAFRARPAQIARGLASRASVPNGARILGTVHHTLPELAAFANGVMVRYLDGNDTFPGGGGHPSDVIPAVIAAAEASDANGAALVTGIVAAYEVYSALFRAVTMREKGLDHVFYTAVASAAGASSVMGLGRSETAHAISLAITPNIALEATRRGVLSEWKGCAAGNGARNGLFAALLAGKGLTGPDRPIEGPHGLWELVGKFELPALAARGDRLRITEANLKYFLAEYHAQSPITAALELSRSTPPEDIERVTLHTYWFAWSEVGNEPEKWRPTTRETADHSLPYMLAAVLLDRQFSEDIFEPHRLADERIHSLSAKIAIEEDRELTARFPQFVPCRLEILTRRGERKVATVDYPRGHFRNPLSDGEVEAKFRALVKNELSAVQIARTLETLWKVDACKKIAEIWRDLEIEEKN